MAADRIESEIGEGLDTGEGASEGEFDCLYLDDVCEEIELEEEAEDEGQTAASELAQASPY